MSNAEKRYRDPMDRYRAILADKTTLPSIAEVHFGLQYDNLADFGSRNHIYEFWTQEYIGAFGDYLASRIAPLAAEKKRKVRILEIGAGDGRLTHFLREEGLKGANALCDVHAADDGSWSIPRIFPVEDMAHEEALQRYQPDIVIASWIPNEGENITQACRATPSVSEYILIGDPHNCGTNDTYGISPDSGRVEWIDEGDGGFKFRNPPEYVPSHERDGFEMVNLQELGKLQIGITNQLGFFTSGRSRTVSFRRK